MHSEKLNGLRILLVDDDELLCTAIRRALLSQGAAEVATAATAPEAIAELNHHPDVIVVDFHLASGTGHEVVKDALAKAPRPLVLAMSGRASRAETFQFAALGAAAFLEKPFQMAELWNAIERALNEIPDLAP